eukprot:scaffold46720_cov24-Cyclotella_meneghiniana.AAC.1
MGGGLSWPYSSAWGVGLSGDVGVGSGRIAFACCVACVGGGRWDPVIVLLVLVSTAVGISGEI